MILNYKVHVNNDLQFQLDNKTLKLRQLFTSFYY